MNNAVIQVDHLTKRYSFQHRSIKNPGSRLDFHLALNDISFNVCKGEIFGIIGPNGSGKSTLLKILTGITSPTTGAVHIQGTISSLLELGAGFHPELTGLENLFIGASLHRYTRNEILTKLESIVHLSGIGPAIYDPVRTYSSGMYVRLAFSLAVHLNPDVLLLDEIFAVGDQEFQRKSYEVVHQLHQNGTTILLVSHDLCLISLVTNRAFFINKGQIYASGPPDTVISAYQSFLSHTISNGTISINCRKPFFHLWSGNRCLSTKMGLYTSFRIDDIWHDSLQMLWQLVHLSETEMILKSSSVAIAMHQEFHFEILESGKIQWTVTLLLNEPLCIQRWQVNMMLNSDFDSWDTGIENGSFPEEFTSFLGDDWDRIALIEPDRTVTASGISNQSKYRVSLSGSMDTGAMAIINSNREMAARNLQYVRVFQNPEIAQQGEMIMFRGWISLQTD